MNWKTLIVEESDKLVCHNNQITLINSQKNTKLQFPFSDINCLLIDNNFATLSINLLNKLIQNNILLIITNEKHDPSALFIGLNNHFSPLSVLKKQLKLTQRFKDLL